MTRKTKRIKPSVTGSSARVEKERVYGWERSKLSKGDQRTLKKFGLLEKDGAMQVPGDEAVPNPPEGFRPLMKEMVHIASRFIRFRDEANSLRKALHLAEKRANDLEKKLKAGEKARKKAEEDAAAIEDLRDRLHAAETALSEKEEKLAKREAAMIARFETQSARSSRKVGEMYTRNQDLEEDPLLDTLTVLEMNCTLARDCLKAARIAFERMFPHFIPKTNLPEKFYLLPKHFNGKDDPALAHRQASLKIGVEGTIALVAASGEKVDWAKVAAVRGLNNDKWTALIKGAKSFSRKIIAILDPRSSASVSTAHTKVK
ncbi:hypothetical protein QYE76_018147 [Lolium multiflorum]|uniref:Uncharacterized protein n=1 Tax=Lolium multiflorum TaxID=4521 RepID=A0AAD8QJP0_LOLMU|nr:hypothetical protein QYE76_018147 [Lolium multiflorum]